MPKDATKPKPARKELKGLIRRNADSERQAILESAIKQAKELNEFCVKNRVGGFVFTNKVGDENAWCRLSLNWLNYLP